MTQKKDDLPEANIATFVACPLVFGRNFLTAAFTTALDSVSGNTSARAQRSFMDRIDEGMKADIQKVDDVYQGDKSLLK